MQLRSARLCLDCEELHEEGQCPACASEAFVFVTRWIPVDDLSTRKRTVPRPPVQPRVSLIVKSGAVGLAALATMRWLLRNPPAAVTRPPDLSGAAGAPDDTAGPSVDGTPDRPSHGTPE